tara:strand:- start:4664 stop:4816 length:153 start_codon:yes stop_codon:yes gene_type:complete
MAGWHIDLINIGFFGRGRTKKGCEAKKRVGLTNLINIGLCLTTLLIALII